MKLNTKQKRSIAYNGWVYMQCEIWNTKLDLITDVDWNGELEYTTEPHITYTPCYVQ